MGDLTPRRARQAVVDISNDDMRGKQTPAQLPHRKRLRNVARSSAADQALSAGCDAAAGLSKVYIGTFARGKSQEKPVITNRDGSAALIRRLDTSVRYSLSAGELMRLA